MWGAVKRARRREWDQEFRMFYFFEETGGLCCDFFIDFGYKNTGL
jgi:hypothetical protein